MLSHALGHPPRTSGRTRRAGALTVGIAAVLAVVLLTPSASNAVSATGPTYLNAKASVAARVEDLLHRMTLAEKIGQMDQIVTGSLRDTSNPADGNCKNAGGNNDPLQPACLDNVLIKNFTGSILAGGTDNPIGNTGAALGQLVQHDPARRGRPLAAAHPGHLRCRRGARLRPPVPGAAVPAVDRHGRHLGPVRGPHRRPGDRPRADGHRLDLGLRAGAGPVPGQPLGPRLRDVGRGAGAVRGDGRRVRGRPAAGRPARRRP